jgi:hypothetical protein
MLAASVLAIAGAAAWSWTLGGLSTVQTVLIALAIGSLATAVPVVMKISADYWGVAVLFSGTVRAMLILGICYMLTQSNQYPNRAIFLPAVTAAIFLLAVESAAAVRILAGLERQKAALRASSH